MYNRPTHGGSAWTIVSGDLEGLKNVVAADVADAWYPPAPEVTEGLREALKYIQWAPDTWGDGLRDYIAAHYQLPNDAIVVDAGSSPLIYRAISAVLDYGDDVIQISPTYSEYEAIAEHNGAQVRQLCLLPEEGFRCDVDRLLSKVDGKTKAVVLCNPNNPTGRALPREDILRLVRALPEQVALIVDEVYIDYAPDCSVLPDVVTSPSLCVIRSFSKSHALAGLRVGFAAAGEAIGRALRKAGEVPWRVSLLADVGARLALRHHGYVKDRIAETIRLREDLRRALALLEGLRPLPSQTNFFLVRLREGGLSSQDLAHRLREEGVLIKAVAPWLRDSDSGFIRITTKSPEDNKRTFDAMKKVIGH
jgi:histidinol-phosphate aminotransferase